jgi:antirestriction protein
MTINTNPTEKPRIYVACLAAYNSGILHGAWIEAIEAWSMWEATRDMLAKSPIPYAEEWAIHDYEGFASIRINEYYSFDRVAELAAFIAKHGALGAELIDHFCGDLGQARRALEDRHLGQYESLADYVQDITEETTAIPHTLRHYIDWQAMARDCELNGDLFTIQTAHDAVHVFAGC